VRQREDHGRNADDPNRAPCPAGDRLHQVAAEEQLLEPRLDPEADQRNTCQGQPRTRDQRRTLQRAERREDQVHHHRGGQADGGPLQRPSLRTGHHPVATDQACRRRLQRTTQGTAILPIRNVAVVTADGPARGCVAEPPTARIPDSTRMLPPIQAATTSRKASMTCDGSALPARAQSR
jgi:hypothetical protein